MYNEGIYSAGELLDMGVDHGLIDKSGAWFSYGDDRIGQGRENAKIFLRENPDIMQNLRSAILVKTGLKAQPGVESSAAQETSGTGE